MSMWNWIIIGCLIVLILYLVLDKLIMPVIRHRRNQREAAQKVFCTFFDPLSNFPQHVLCHKKGDWLIEAPEEHRPFFSKNGGGDKKEKEPLEYSMIGMQVTGYTQEGKAIEKPYRVTIRDAWPPNVRESEQVLVEHGFWVKGRTEALNPYNNFFPINTGRMTQALRDDKTTQALAKISERALEDVENLEKAMTRLAKLAPWILAAACGSALFSLVGAVFAYLIKKGM